MPQVYDLIALFPDGAADLAELEHDRMTVYRHRGSLSDMASGANSLSVLAIVAFSSLAPVSSATAQELETADPDPDRAEQVDPRKETLGLQVPLDRLASHRRRAAYIEARQEIDRAIADLQQLSKEVAQEREEWQRYLEQISAQLVEIAEEIDEVEAEIDDTEVAIAATLGVGGSVLIARLGSLNADLDSLHEQRRAAERERERAFDHIADLDELTQEIENKIEALHERLEELERKRFEVIVTAPAEGARLLVASDQELRISADKRPWEVRIEIQKEQTRGGTAPNDPLRKVWTTVYNRTWEWRRLRTERGAVASLRFKTVELVSGQALPPDPSTLRLDRGVYRARVQRIGPPHLDAGPWRSFSVVGRIGGEILQQPAPRPGTVKLRPGAKPKP